ncbi:pentapeptide repeat-containing protein [Streptomyces wedmorensis]
MAASLPGLAALLALLFTWMQVTQTGKELEISEQGQITDRFNAAVDNLGSDSPDVRLGGIYALERIMHDSARDHPTVVSVLAAYVRKHAALPDDATKNVPPKLDEDVQAAVTVVANRSPDRDQGPPINLSHTALRGLELLGNGDRIDFRGARLQEADLSNATIRNADFRNAWLFGANLSGATVETSNFSGATLWEANLTKTLFCTASLNGTYECSDLTGAYLVDANLTEANLMGANLTGATFCLDDPAEFGYACANLAGATLWDANLKGAFLSGANLKGADLSGANLAGADVSGSDFTGASLAEADLTGAKVAGAKFKGADLEGVRGMRPP